MSPRDPLPPDVDDAPTTPVHRVPRVRVVGPRVRTAAVSASTPDHAPRGEHDGDHDEIAVEQPLQLRIHTVPIAVVMRTPGDDEALALGFLLSEGVIHSVDDVVAIRPCEAAHDGPGEGNVLDIRLAAHVSVDLQRLKRNTFAASSCGVCGRAAVDDLLARCTQAPPADRRPPLDLQALLRCHARLRDHQPLFDRTGGVHAAALSSEDGPQLLFEDVGRHNATDRVIGAAARARLDLRDRALLLSGRVSFELVQKAAAAGIPAIVAVSAASSLAIEAAQAAGVALVAFARPGRATVYTHADRFTPASLRGGDRG